MYEDEYGLMGQISHETMLIAIATRLPVSSTHELHKM